MKMTESCECVYCEKPIVSGPIEMYGGDPLHAACYVQLGHDLDYVERRRALGFTTYIGEQGERRIDDTIDCDHCLMPISDVDPVWASFDLTLHASCKQEWIAMQAAPITPDRPTIRQRLILLTAVIHEPRDNYKCPKWARDVIDLIFPK